MKALVKAPLFALSLALATTTVAAISIPTNLSQAAATTVAQALDTAADGDYVAFKGQVNRQLSSEQYMLTDPTGVIQLEIAEKLGRLLPINPPIEVEVFGVLQKNEGNTPQLLVSYYAVHDELMDEFDR